MMRKSAPNTPTIQKLLTDDYLIEGLVIPANVNLNRNILEATQHKWDLTWFYKQVTNKSPWDYKQYGRAYQEFGNFHYGVVGTAAKFPSWLLLRMAGARQEIDGTSAKKWSNPFWIAPYGDDPNDQAMINKGIEYAKRIIQNQRKKN